MDLPVVTFVKINPSSSCDFVTLAIVFLYSGASLCNHLKIKTTPEVGPLPSLTKICPFGVSEIT